jgi:replication-associated recombination protein RarA
MKPPVFHPVTAQTLELLGRDLPQSLLLSGPHGIGLLTAAQWLAGKQCAGILQPKDAKGNLSENGTIGVEAIRNLYDQTRTKHTSRHIILIDNADHMSRGAQGAFLKLLEEPGNDIYFILTAHRPHLLLPTIRSRVQHTELRTLTASGSDQLIAHLGVTDSKKQAQLAFIALGLPAELTRLTEDDVYFRQAAQMITDARDFLQADRYKKMLIIHSYRQDRAKALQFIDTTLVLLRRSLNSKPQSSTVRQLESLLEARDCINSNGNIGLQLARIVL